MKTIDYAIFAAFLILAFCVAVTPARADGRARACAEAMAGSTYELDLSSAVYCVEKLSLLVGRLDVAIAAGLPMTDGNDHASADRTSLAAKRMTHSLRTELEKCFDGRGSGLIRCGP